MKRIEIIIPHERPDRTNNILEQLMLVECLSIILAAEVKQNGSQYLLEEEL